MGIRSKHLLVGAVAGLLACPAVTLATNGYFAIGYGAAAEGMGGAAVAFPQDAMSAAANPATLGDVGIRFDIGVGLFDARRCAGEVGLFAGNADSSGKANCSKSGVDTFIIPGMGFSFAFNDQLSIGFAAVGNGGMNTTYKPNFFSRGGATPYLGVDMVQLFVPITASWKFNPTHTVGFSIVPARQRFLAQGLQAFTSYSSDPDHLTNMGHDYANGLGTRVGWLGHFMEDKLTLGATYASKVYMQKFKLYKGLFAEGGSFDVPANYAIGIGYKVTPQVAFAMDVQRILYTGVPSVGNIGPTNILYSGDPIYDSANHQLGTRNGMGFGWKDQTVYKLGVRYKPNDKWTLRAGYNYGKSPVPNSQLLFNLLAPGIVEKHATLGLTYNLGEQSILGFGSEGELTFSYIHAFKKRQEATLLFDNTSPVNAVAEMFQNAVTLAYTLKF